MNHIRGMDREQTLLLPETIEDYVAADNPVRFIDAFVSSLDLHALGFAKAIAAYTGRPSYEPGALLRLEARAGTTSPPNAWYGCYQPGAARRCRHRPSIQAAAGCHARPAPLSTSCRSGCSPTNDARLHQPLAAVAHANSRTRPKR